MDYSAVVSAFQQGCFPACEALLREGLRHDPDSPRLNHDLGVAVMAQGRFGEARPVLERFHGLMPQHLGGRIALGKARLATGDFAGGWPLYDERLSLPEQEVPPYPAWTGQPLDGATVVVWREQGFGDMIQCLRFLPRLRRAGARVIAVSPPALARLHQSLGFEAVPHHAPIGVFPDLPVRPDLCVHPFSLPRRLGVEAGAIPAAPYVFAEPRRRGGIGVVWRGNPKHQYDGFRSLPPALGAELLDLPGAVSLEPADTGAGDFLDTTAVIAGLDLVISVDTAVAHLAGAMGKPVAILLGRHGQDWRWMEGRTDTPWYPGTRLYRQETPGDWHGVVDRVRADLRAGDLPVARS